MSRAEQLPATKEVREFRLKFPFIPQYAWIILWEATRRSILQFFNIHVKKFEYSILVYELQVTIHVRPMNLTRDDYDVISFLLSASDQWVPRNAITP